MHQQCLEASLGMPKQCRLGMPKQCRLGMPKQCRLGMPKQCRLGMPKQCRLGISDDNPCNDENDEKHEAECLPSLRRAAGVIG